MRRYWWEGETLHLDKEVVITGELFHHICDVCRLEEGAKFELLTTETKAFLVHLTSKSKRSASGKVLEERALSPLPLPYLHLCLSVPKFNTLDMILEKAVELGVFRLQLFFSDYSFVRTPDKITPSRIARWQKIVKSASQQSGRSPLMQVTPPKKLTQLLMDFKNQEGVQGIFPYEGECQQNLKQALQEMKATPCQEVWMFVGSEGGFSDKEVQLFQNYNLKPLSLGPQVLRVETAAIAITSMIRYEWDLL